MGPGRSGVGGTSVWARIREQHPNTNALNEIDGTQAGSTVGRGSMGGVEGSMGGGGSSPEPAPRGGLVGQHVERYSPFPPSKRHIYPYLTNIAFARFISPPSDVLLVLAASTLTPPVFPPPCL